MLYLISGIPGAGKTTVSRLLAERFDRSVHLEGDVIGDRFIVNGAVLPSEEPRDEVVRQLKLRRRNITLLAKSYMADDFTVVIDDVVVTPGVLTEHYADLPHPFTFVQLTPRLEIVEQRDAGREKQFFQVFKDLDPLMRSWPEPRPGVWLDSSDMSATETVDGILAAERRR